MSLKVLIADDKFEMRMILKKALSKINGIEIIGEAENGKDAVLIVEKEKPDSVFLDVEMPVVDGIEAAKQIIDINPKTMIVFITAYQQYMPQAFELYSFDYMIKPFKIDRLNETVERMFEVKSNNLNKTSKKIVLKTKNRQILVQPDNIILVQRENRTTTVITKNEKYSISHTLSEMENILPKEIFLRSHKSYIININRIKEVEQYGRWTYVVKFDCIDEDALLTYEKGKSINII